MSVIGRVTLAFAAFPSAAPAIASPSDACALARASPRGADVSVPFRNVDGRVYVDARVNGRGPYTFAVDTGAGGMGRADRRLVTALALQPTGSRDTSDGIKTSAAPTVRLGTVAIGRLVRSNLDVVTRDYNRNARPDAAISGILGRDFFADGLLVIDYRKQRLTFTRSRGLTAATPGVLNYQRPFRVDASVGTVATQGHIDTGANVAMIVPRALFDAASAGRIGEAATGILTNTSISTSKATLSVPVRIGALVLTDTEARVSGEFPELLIGGPALTGAALLIDQRSRLLAICETRRR